MKKVLTVCPYCGCGCSLYLHVDNNQITGASPSENHPVNRGTLCLKGWNVHEFVNHPDRLKYPLIKKGGAYKRAGWEEVSGLIAGKFSSIRKKHGPDSLGILSSAKCTNEENYLIMKFARAVLGTNNIDHCARLCHSSTVGGLSAAFGSGAMTNSISEIDNARVLFVIGSNTTEQHPMIWMHMMRAIENGATLIVADPRRTHTAEFAHIFLQHRSGTDVILLMGIMNVIVSEGLVDRDFVRMRTENFDEFEAKLEGYDLDTVEAITGISSAEIKRVARIYASEKRTMLFYAMGVTQHITGVDNVKACANLVMLTGHIGVPSSGLNPLRGQNNVQGACDMGALPNVYSGYQKVSDREIREKFEAAWKVRLPEIPGLTIMEMMDAAYEGRMKGMYIIGENPLLSDPDLRHVQDSMKRLEFVVVQDIFPSETSEYADVILPAVSFAEKDGTFTNTERRVQLLNKAVEPVGEAKSDWEIISLLSGVMGYPLRYNNSSEIAEEINILTPSYGGILHRRLRENFGLQWPCPHEEHPGTPFLHRKRFTKGAGTFSQIEFIPPDEPADSDYPMLLTTGRLYYHFHTGTMCRRTVILDRDEPECHIEINPGDARTLNISNNTVVKVSSRRGSIKVRALITSSSPKGIVFLPFHFREAAANILTNPAMDPGAKIPEYKVCAVRLDTG